MSLPPTYRRFISELGAGSFGSREFYGAIDTDFAEATIPDGIWLTLDERDRFGFPDRFAIIGDTGMGEYYVLDISSVGPDDECPVAVWVPGVSQTGDRLEVVADDFGSYFWEAIQQVRDRG
jgi:hypothetical protein